MTDSEVVTRYLIPGEEVFAWVRQRRIAGIWPLKPDYVVLTGRRFLVIHPSFLACSFEDVQLIDLKDIHVRENFLGAEITCSSLDGRQLSVSLLDPDRAIAVYQAGQGVEEHAREARRQRQMEESRAAAANISMGK